MLSAIFLLIAILASSITNASHVSESNEGFLIRFNTLPSGWSVGPTLKSFTMQSSPHDALFILHAYKEWMSHGGVNGPDAYIADRLTAVYSARHNFYPYATIAHAMEVMKKHAPGVRVAGATLLTSKLDARTKVLSRLESPAHVPTGYMINRYMVFVGDACVMTSTEGIEHVISPNQRCFVVRIMHKGMTRI